MLGLLSATFIGGRFLQPYIQLRGNALHSTVTESSPQVSPPVISEKGTSTLASPAVKTAPAHKTASVSAAEKTVPQQTSSRVAEKSETVQATPKVAVRPNQPTPKVAVIEKQTISDQAVTEKVAPLQSTQPNTVLKTPATVKVTNIPTSQTIPVAANTQPPKVSPKPKPVAVKMGESWAQSQVEKYSFDFDAADKDNSGNLSYSEVKAVLETRGWKGSDEEAQKIFSGLDMTKDGKVTKVEYVAAVKKIPGSAMKEMALRRAFKILDKDKSGSLNRGEIAGATSKECGLDMKAEKIADLLTALTKDEDQALDYEEFLAVFGIQHAGLAMETAFKLIDTDGSGFLTKDELINAVKADEELSIKADKISALLSAWCRDDDKKINYAEFVKVWTAQKPTKK